MQLSTANLEGVETLRTLVDRGGDRIAVMAGGRLDLDHLEAVIQRSEVREIHLGSAVSRTVAGAVPTPDRSETAWSRTDDQRVAAVVARVRSFEGS